MTDTQFFLVSNLANHPSIYTLGGEGAQREEMVNPGLANREAIQTVAAMRASDYIDDGLNVLFTDTIKPGVEWSDEVETSICRWCCELFIALLHEALPSFIVGSNEGETTTYEI